MDTTIIIVIALAVFLFLLLTGHYISTVLLGAGIVGLFFIGGGSLSMVQGFLVNEPYAQAASYTLTTVPLYVIMAQFIMKSGIIADCYTIVFKASKGKRSVLGILTILLGGFLGAVSGSGTATAASLGKISVPELRSRGYSDSLSGAVAAVSGSLSAVIPPSLTLIIYGSVSGTSVGQLFMAAVIPGILIMAMFAVVTIVLLGTKNERAQMEEQMEKYGKVEEATITTGRMIFVLAIGLALILIIFLGIYTGKFSPTEAGAIGAFLGFVVAIITRTLNLKMLMESMLETVKVTGMTALIITAASIFSRFVTLSQIPRRLMATLGGLIEHPALLLALLMVIYFVLFMILDGSSAILMTMPVLLPIIQAIHVDLLWFGIFVCMLSTMGSLTPPVGFCTYAVAGASRIPLGKIFPKTLLYAVVVTVVVGALMIAFPALATWLPSTM